MDLPCAYAPPAFLKDLEHVDGGMQEWSHFISTCLRDIVEIIAEDVAERSGRPWQPQFFDALQPGCCDPEMLVRQPIFWNAFPKTYMLRGRDWALRQADSLWPLNPDHPTKRLYRLQDEYCEWRVERDAATGKISRVVFTCEPPEYWFAIYGGEVDTGRTSISFTGNREYARHLYHELTGGDVQPGELEQPEGGYDVMNRWNSTHGIVHLANPSNSIVAEVTLAAYSTLLRARGGEPITNADELCACLGNVECDRNSDPTIVGIGNALARLGARVTLADPVGIYMTDLDTSGWSLPGNVNPAECWKFTRGQKGMMTRVVVEAPPGSGLTVGDLRIGGDPVLFGGQIAECITVNLLGAGDLEAGIRNSPVPYDAVPCLAALPSAVPYTSAGDRSAGLRPSFGYKWPRGSPGAAGPVSAPGSPRSRWPRRP